MLALTVLSNLRQVHGRLPDPPLFGALLDSIVDLFDLEEIGSITPEWPLIESDVEAAVSFRRLLDARSRWVHGFDARFDAIRSYLLPILDDLLHAVPQSCFEAPAAAGLSFDVPVGDLIHNPAGLIGKLVLLPFVARAESLGVFRALRAQTELNLLTASGLPPHTKATGSGRRFIFPDAQVGKSPQDLNAMYLAHTPFARLLDTAVPFSFGEEVRYEHCHIVGGTGHGKTQLMQRMIHGDLEAARHEKRSIVVIDSQGDMISRLQRLALFSPEAENSLAERLVIIDPADVEFPAALNLFDAHLSRTSEYRPADRERVLNGVVELYETFFGELLGSELTQKQGVVFKYLARLMLAIPGATIHTLMELMEDGRRFKPHMDRLEGSARYFFETEFFHPSFAATKKQVLRRLWGVLSTPAFERMFAQKRNKLDLFQAMQDGKIILINTAADLLKREGSQLFGRFFIAMLAQAALERSTVAAGDRTPCMVYVDEAQEYFGDDVEVILNQARKYRMGLTVAHQTLDQLSPRLRAVLHANTSTKCVGGVSAKDSRALADELHTTSHFIESMRRRRDATEFALWVKHQTASAIRLNVPLGHLERQEVLTEEAYEALIARNRRLYCGTIAGAAPPARPNPEPPQPQAADSSEDARVGRATAPSGVASEPAEASHDAPSEDVRPPPTRPAPSATAPHVPGKGGPQHRYVQHLIKKLAEERGFRAVIEDAVPGGHVDVGLHRDDVTIACEISVTSSAEYEVQNLAKCLRAGFTRVWAIAPDAKRQRSIQRAVAAKLGDEEAAKIEFLTTDAVVATLDSLVDPEPRETTVRGYKVSVSRKSLSPEEARQRQAAIAKILAGSFKDQT